jgi:hypothetical protein
MTFTNHNPCFGGFGGRLRLAATGSIVGPHHTHPARVRQRFSRLLQGGAGRF